MGRKKKFENQPEVIVEAAHQLFNQNGYAKTTMDDIAREVGIGKATLYGDFASKEEIMLAVVKRVRQQVIDCMSTSLRKGKGTHLERIHAAVLNHCLLLHDTIRQHHTNTQLVQEIIAKMGKPYWELRQSAEEQRCELLAQELEKAAEAGEIAKSTNYRYIAQLIFSSVESLTTSRFDTPRSQNQKMASDILDFVLSGLKVKAK